MGLEHAVTWSIALGSLVAGVALAAHHPLWPMAALVLLCFWCMLVIWRPGLWLLAVPACLPFLNFSPWTGWIVFEELDIMLLGTLAGAYAQAAWGNRFAKGPGRIWSTPVWMVLLAGSALLGLYRGFYDAGSGHFGLDFDWFAGYADALNSLRVFKSLGFAVLLYPLLQEELDRSAARASKRLAMGMVVGLTITGLAVLWERAAFPGVWEFSAPYRTVALFWEMHVGGAAIDVYLALACPFVVWTVVAARRPLAWLSAALLALLSTYVCLTTFARGVYLAVVAPLLLLAVLLRRQRSQAAPLHHFIGLRDSVRLQGWRGKASFLLGGVLLGEVLVVLWGGTYMAQRLAHTGQDFSSRVVHWEHGLGLLQGPDDWLLGIGLGRLPGNFAQQVPQGEFSGEVQWKREPAKNSPDNAFITLRGPATMGDLGGLFALTQRVDLVPSARYRVELTVRVQRHTALEVTLCERHLLYERNCKRRFLRVKPLKHEGLDAWQSVSLPLSGEPLSAGHWFAPRLTLLSVSVVNAGGAADLDKLKLLGARGDDLLINGEFSAGLAHWSVAAQSYFLPWHLDNLLLEVLVERGAVGLVLLLTLFAYALWQLAAGRLRQSDLSPYVAASLSGALLVGLVSSVMDVPRVALLFYLILFMGLQKASVHAAGQAAPG
jgi:hypothetical protein